MFRRLANVFRGFLGLFVSGLERRNPEALLEVEKENLRKQIANYNEGLAAHAGLCASATAAWAVRAGVCWVRPGARTIHAGMGTSPTAERTAQSPA